MKKQFKYLCVLLGGVVAACNGGGSGSSDDSQLNAIQDQIRNVYFYRSNDAIKAIDYNDPTNPITIEPASNSLTAFTAQEVLTPFGSNPTRYYASSGSLIYAKDGRFWHVDNNAANNLTPRLLSTESNAIRVCNAKQVLNSSNQTIHHYSIPGPSGNCSYIGNQQDPNNNGAWLPVFPDLIYKWLTLDMDAASPPNPGSTEDAIDPYNNPLLFYQPSSQPGSSTVRGLLTLDDLGNLLWFEGTDFSAPAHTVATGVTSLSSFPNYGNDWVYIIVDGSIYSYSPGDTSLGTSLYQVSQNFIWDGSSPLSNEYFYVVDGQRLLKLSTTTPGSPDIIVDDPRLLDFLWPIVGETETHIFLLADWLSGTMIYSVELETGAITDLLTAAKEFFMGPPSLYGVLFNDKIYYYNFFSDFTGIITIDGDEIRTFPGMGITGYVYSPVIESGRDKLTHLLLSQLIDESTIAISALDIETDSISRQLGTAQRYSLRPARITRQYDGKMILFPTNQHLIDNGEIYFADLNQDNSLLQLTDDTTVDTPIHSTWVDPGPLVPASPTP